MQTPAGFTPINGETWTCFTCDQEFTSDERMYRTEEGEPVCSGCKRPERSALSGEQADEASGNVSPR